MNTNKQTISIFPNQVSDEEHEEFSKLCKLLDRIRFKDEKASFQEPVDLEKFLPGDDDEKTFWTYDGSLTTPPLLESVTWIVFKNTLKISEDQVFNCFPIKRMIFANFLIG